MVSDQRRKTQATAEQMAEQFLKKSHLFTLGDLPTEQPHPQTQNLSEWARKDLPKAIEVLRQVDLDAVEKLMEYKASLHQLAQDIEETLSSGHRVFLCGCGATGRLALSLEALWRYIHPGNNQVVGFMAGGDVALVHALEGFEDEPDFGARQLEELRFAPQDLLVSCTEGGETPFVIGATLRAKQISKRAPYFLYCNPEPLLKQKVNRSAQVIEDSGIHSVSLFVGPMALAGSTRLQATTVLQLAVGLALFFPKSLEETLEDWTQFIGSQNRQGLIPFIEKESQIYQSQNHVIYSAEEFALTVLTDTTERAPTFSLPSFDNQRFPQPHPSLAYVMIPSVKGALSSWRSLLGRDPRPLDWPEVKKVAGEDYLLGFDFGKGALSFRNQLDPQHKQVIFTIARDEDQFLWQLQGHCDRWSLFSGHPLFSHLQLKLWLNCHSTLVMGRLGRYERNLMIWVKPSNGKLIDRAARYVLWLLKQEGISKVSYDVVVRQIFAVSSEPPSYEPVVLKVRDKVLSELQRSSSS